MSHEKVITEAILSLPNKDKEELDTVLKDIYKLMEKHFEGDTNINNFMLALAVCLAIFVDQKKAGSF